MTLLRDSPDGLFALCGAAADSLGIPEPAFVEKGFWVVELLRSVVRPLELEPVNNIPCSATVRFKGGTSLSKAFGLIKRFSEDLDILIECEGYGAGAREKRVLRPICERVGRDLGPPLEEVAWLPYRTGVTRNADYLVPAVWIPPPYGRVSASRWGSAVARCLAPSSGVFVIHCRLHHGCWHRS
jgi:Nucleotidyl transferase AbiEii toxin, Type IV TA system